MDQLSFTAFFSEIPSIIFFFKMVYIYSSVITGENEDNSVFADQVIECRNFIEQNKRYLRKKFFRYYNNPFDCFVLFVYYSC